ncbi:putative sulfate:proton symporter (anion:anion symporter or antiporter of the sulfate permease SulP family) [Candidatus Sulfotelmatobacter kueseliae]|uniref:Putative sulfate:proton symporter (Anion:anion symporter or antiporter of the sulfate permease SulP family) n=1 Tax=Candidatus Sulfotelmatobacter kueseliae TaxID=2042962 RepID=A0A2U3JY03_9BACT|nr:putative sulfate:proton symporter (anion:anion symporter or antiporter of the sulfate permease SulP family) [Candidatus Sulfotelmatobacter kueseliae]
MVGAFLNENWLPKSVLCLRDYTRHKFLLDVIAGLTVGLVALPLAMAFAIASGLTPQAGIYCAIVTGFLVSALGGSKTQIGGPTGAFVVVVAGIIAVHGVDGLFMCTVMAGIFLIVMGLTGLGTAVKFIPRPVVIGFTNGIAVLIASTQIKDFFGLHLDKVPGVFWQRVEALASSFHTLSFEATALAVFTLLTLIICRGLSARIPGPIVALLLSTCAVYFFHLPVETIGTRFGGIPGGLPHLQIPQFRSDLIHGLLGPAFTVAMLGAIESLMSAVVSDRMSNDRHNPNVELVAQGVANVFSPMFGGLPATGAIARTATNIRSGAQSPVAGIIHALTLLCILLFAAPLVSYIPMAALAGILMIVSYNMGEWREIPQLLKLTKTDISIWLVTFALTVFADLTVAVEAGMILAALLFISRVASTTTVSQVTDDYVEDGRVHILQDKDIPYYATIFRIHGPFLFGATDKISAVTENLHRLPPVVILRLRNMTALDATGLFAIEEAAKQLHASKRTLILCGAREQPLKLMHQAAEFEEVLGKENICDNVQEALRRAEEVYEGLQPQTPAGKL